jgi:hypothetical protein
MHKRQIYRLAILLFLAIACVNKNSHESSINIKNSDNPIEENKVSADTFEIGKVISKVVCSADVNSSYALYLPSKAKNEALPVIYFFDPHGDGSLPLDKYQSLAEKYGFIFIGSNNSKNGNDWATTENIWNILAQDSQKKLKLNTNRIYTCGFSGGAKVATYIGLNHHEVQGVIANGAGLPEMLQSGNLSFTFTAIAGEGDLNMTDLVAINNGLGKTQTRHRILFFDGIHEWAPLNTMDMALNAFCLDAMREGLAKTDTVFISADINRSKKEIANLLTKNNFIRADEACTFAINTLAGLSVDVKWFEEKKALIENNRAYLKQSKAKYDLVIKEQNIKALYEKQFQHGDINYWIGTIKDDQIRATGGGAEAAMYRRLIAYLSLAFYSISNQLINSNQNAEAQQFANFYKLADPKNSEAWYLSAIINARASKAKATREDLLHSISLGFSDKNRIINQTEFQSLAGQLDLNEIENKMK